MQMRVLSLSCRFKKPSFSQLVVLVRNMSLGTENTLSNELKAAAQGETAAMEVDGAAPDAPNIVKEGKAEVFSPKSVFYNPVQEFNRDLTVSVISRLAHEHFTIPTDKKGRRKRKQLDDAEESKPPETDSSDDQKVESTESKPPVNLEAGKKYDDGLRILEGLAASGLRSVRFAREIAGVCQVFANDFDQTAVEFIKKNVEHNGIHDLVTASHSDASLLMYQNRHVQNRFDVIDLDPYGAPSVFLDAAVQAVKDDGVLCVTSTDMAVLCGNSPETCYSKYGSLALKTRCCHEMALRILLQSIESHANRYSRYITPLLAVSVDFYIRVFVRINTGQAKVKESVTKLSNLFVCVGCGAHSMYPLAHKVNTKNGGFKFVAASAPMHPAKCEHCGARHHVGGPLWNQPIYDRQFVEKVLEYVSKSGSNLGTSERIKGILTVILEELEDVPLYYITDDLCKTLHCTPPNMIQFRSAIMNAGYDVSLSHAAMNSIKTTAPLSVLWDILRTWVKDHPVSQKRMVAGTPQAMILAEEPSTKVSFEVREDANPESRRQQLLRWQANPERDWGPKARAKHGVVESLQDRRDKGNQKAQERQAKRKADEASNGQEAKKMNTEPSETACDTTKMSESEELVPDSDKTS